MLAVVGTKACVPPAKVCPASSPTVPAASAVLLAACMKGSNAPIPCCVTACCAVTCGCVNPATVCLGMSLGTLINPFTKAGFGDPSGKNSSTP